MSRYPEFGDCFAIDLFLSVVQKQKQVRYPMPEVRELF